MNEMNLWQANGTYFSDGEPYGNETQITTSITVEEAEAKLQNYWKKLGYDSYELSEIDEISDINGYTVQLTPNK